MTLRRNDFRSRLAAALLAGAVAVTGLAGSAAGQLGLQDALVNAPTIGGAEKDQIRQYVESNKAGLSGDIEAIASSRRALLRPFRAPAVSSAFRLAYAEQLIPLIRPLASGAKDEAAINAVRIAGELGTRDALAVLAAALKDKRPAVRVVAAKGFEQTLVSSRSQPAIVVRDAGGALEDLKAAFIAETEPQVADAIMGALDAGVRTDPAVLTGVRADAVRAISEAFSAKVKAPGWESFAASLARAIESLHDAVTTGTGAGALAAPSLKEAGGVAGDMIAAGLRMAVAGAGGKPPEGESLARMKQLLAQAENLYFFSHSKIGGGGGGAGGAPLRRDLGTSFAADNAKFRRDALEVLGVLTNPSGPFGLPAERFPKG